MYPTEINRLRINKFLIQVTQNGNTKFIISRTDRRDLPHLTVSIGNTSGLIDVHLTEREKGGKENYIEIAKIRDEDFAIAMASSLPLLQNAIFQNWNKIKKVRPGWLARKFYVISYLDENMECDFIDKLAPKRKYHSKWERYLESSNFDKYVNSEEAMNLIFHPSVLHDLAKSENKKPIFAVRIWGKNKPKIIPLMPLPNRSGKISWYRCDAVIKTMQEGNEDYISRLKRLLPEDAWEKINREMHLEDF